MTAATVSTERLTPALGQRATRSVLEAVEAVLTGHSPTVKLALCALLARGHVLLEDVPGVGKTTLVRAFAAALGGAWARIQFTADMLPGDVLGLQSWDAATQTLSFRPGPLFAEIVLADEINRASPKTQSALLEAMAERAVTIEGKSYPLPKTFCVLATQNPVEQHGAYPLPESQLDRFMVCLSLGYPPAASELALLADPTGPARRLSSLAPVLNTRTLVALHELVDEVAMHSDVSRYLLALVTATRVHPAVRLGVSPRGAIALSQLARAWALLAGREYVVPDDIKALAPYALAHRLVLREAHVSPQALVGELLAQVAVPR